MGWLDAVQQGSFRMRCASPGSRVALAATTGRARLAALEVCQREAVWRQRWRDTGDGPYAIDQPLQQAAFVAVRAFHFGMVSAPWL
mmetsp:Transcript_133440/g.414957  ORF Transcript_133440/g.414957 Transcript_133440/m.414957 type:complete len:86 (+) Transcript_133440:66-323(+)